jgi:hypothetical protein
MRYFFAFGILISLMSCNAPSGIHRVWAVDDSEKIKQEDIENPLAFDDNNAVWKNNRIHIFGGKNIPALVTNNIKPGLKGYVDFWSISSQEFTLNITPEDIAAEKALGHKFGIYNGYQAGDINLRDTANSFLSFLLPNQTKINENFTGSF